MKIRIKPEIKFLLSLMLIVGIIAFAFWLSQVVSNNSYIQEVMSRYGYLGIFVAAVISGFNLVVPIPAASFIPALLESGLTYWPSILILALGMTTADLIAYILGRAGRGVFTNAIGQRMLNRLDKLSKRHPVFPFFAIFGFAAFAPVPNEVILVPLGFLRYRMLLTITAIFLGNLVFNALYSLGFIGLFNVIK